MNDMFLMSSWNDSTCPQQDLDLRDGMYHLESVMAPAPESPPFGSGYLTSQLKRGKTCWQSRWWRVPSMFFWAKTMGPKSSVNYTIREWPTYYRNGVMIRIYLGVVVIILSTHQKWLKMGLLLPLMRSLSTSMSWFFKQVEPVDLKSGRWNSD